MLAKLRGSYNVSVFGVAGALRGGGIVGAFPNSVGCVGRDKGRGVVFAEVLEDVPQPYLADGPWTVLPWGSNCEDCNRFSIRCLVHFIDIPIYPSGCTPTALWIGNSCAGGRLGPIAWAVCVSMRAWGICG